MSANESASFTSRGEGRLWGIALGLSLLVNIGILGVAGFVSVKSQIDRKNRPESVTAPTVTTVTIVPVFPVAPAATPPAETPPPTEGKPSFARTSEDQASAPPDRPAFIGERDTLATSDRAPDANAPPMPSQKGEEPRNPEDFETTESDYQDGKLAASQPLPAANPPAPTPPAPMADPSLAEATSPGEKAEIPGSDLLKSSPPPREKLMEGPNPVDVPVPLDVAEAEVIKPTPPKLPKPEEKASNVEESPKPKPERQPVPNDPVFRGNQRKTAIVGSISRNGRSALLGICFWRDAPETAVGPDRRAGKRGLIPSAIPSTDYVAFSIP